MLIKRLWHHLSYVFCTAALRILERRVVHCTLGHSSALYALWWDVLGDPGVRKSDGCNYLRCHNSFWFSNLPYIQRSTIIVLRYATVALTCNSRTMVSLLQHHAPSATSKSSSWVLLSANFSSYGSSSSRSRSSRGFTTRRRTKRCGTHQGNFLLLQAAPTNIFNHLLLHEEEEVAVSFPLILPATVSRLLPIHRARLVCSRIVCRSLLLLFASGIRRHSGPGNLLNCPATCASIPGGRLIDHFRRDVVTFGCAVGSVGVGASSSRGVHYFSGRHFSRAEMMNGSSAGNDERAAFERLKSKLKEIQCLEGVQALLTWDQQVYMPPNGVAARGEQLAVIARVMHAHKTSDAIGESLDTLLAVYDTLGEKGFNPAEIASVREAGREYTRTKKKPVELAARSAELEATGVAAWQKARKENSFSLFASVLQEWVDIVREEAATVEPGIDVYDYCLDKFERGSTVKSLDPFFASIKSPLITMVRRIQQTREGPNKQFLESKDLFSGMFSLETQKRLAKQFAGEIGFDFSSGRFDESTHPMTISIASPLDVRITSRFSETEISSGILATLHEAGHGLYEQGLNAQACKDGLLVSKPPGMGLHESQSLLWEKQVGMSAEYWDHYWPVILRSFSSLPSSQASDYHKVINEIKPGMSRVNADELSYPLHILLRFEIEKGLLDGSIKVAEVPTLWNKKMEEYLGIVPKNDTEGCLQDIHWGLGLFGYFPTYTLGAVYASMIFQAAEKEIPGLRKSIQEGKFSSLREWLREKIHTVGSLYETADELIEKVTGSKLNAACFLNYLSRKYGALYNLSSSELEAFAVSR